MPTRPAQAAAMRKRELVDRVVARSLALAADPLADQASSQARSVAELGGLAGHSRSVLGRAWLEVVVPALRWPSPVAIAAEQLLAAALESEGLDERLEGEQQRPGEGESAA